MQRRKVLIHSLQPIEHEAFLSLLTMHSKKKGIYIPLNQVQEDAKDLLCYTVIIAYAEFDSHDDKRGFGDEPDVWRVIVHSQTTMQAISRAMEIVNTCIAEIMTDFYTGHPMFNNQEMFSRDDVDFMREDAEKEVYLETWLDMEPTSIQAYLTADHRNIV